MRSGFFVQIMLLSSGLAEYSAKVSSGDIEFPIPDNCPNPDCGAHHSFQGHGWYHRFAWNFFDRLWQLISIRRYLCKSCGKTISFLPSFLMPRFHFSICAIIWSLLFGFTRNKSFGSLHRFHKKRLLSKIQVLIMSLRESGWSADVSCKCPIKKAISVLLGCYAGPGIEAFASKHFDKQQKALLAL